MSGQHPDTRRGSGICCHRLRTPVCSVVRMPLSTDDASEQSSEASSAAEDADQESQPSSEQEDSAAGQTWRAHIRRTDAADDPRWRLEIGILSNERNGQQVLEVRHRSAIILYHGSMHEMSIVLHRNPEHVHQNRSEL